MSTTNRAVLDFALLQVQTLIVEVVLYSMVQSADAMQTFC